MSAEEKTHIEINNHRKPEFLRILVKKLDTSVGLDTSVEREKIRKRSGYYIKCEYVG